MQTPPASRNIFITISESLIARGEDMEFIAIELAKALRHIITEGVIDDDLAAGGGLTGEFLCLLESPYP